MELHELPDLSDWRFIEVWTVEEAAMLWAAIDPMDYKNIRLTDLKNAGVRLLQYKKAQTYQRAISEAVCGGTLPFVDAWEFHDDFNNNPWEKRVGFPDLPDHNRINCHKTRVSQAAFMKWVDSKKMPSFKQCLQAIRDVPKREVEIDPSVIGSEAILESSVLALPLPAYLDPDHPRHAPRLRAAILAWQAVPEPPPGKTAKQGLKEWVMENAARLGLLHDDGSLIKEAIELIGTMANWDKKGGPPKTPGNLPTP